MRGMNRYVVVLGTLSLIPMMLQASPAPTDLNAIQSALGVPLSIAKVSDGVLAPGQRLPDLILVQDIHRHPEVQGDIAAILLYGSHHWDLKEVYLEGADAQAEVTRPMSNDMKSIREALHEGTLSGAEMAVALEPVSPLEFHGLEDATLYRENVEAYELVEQLRKPALRELDTVRLFEKSLDVETGSPGSKSWVLLQRLLELRLKPAERLAYLVDPYRGPNTSALYNAVQAADKFYALADQRSQVFLKNMPSVSGGAPQLLIVGGYHTDGMARELRQQGRSFAVLSPHVTQSGFDELYARSMQQTISALKLRPQQGTAPTF